MKKSVCLLLAVWLLCLCSCGGPEPGSAPAEPAASEASENSDAQEARVMTMVRHSEQGLRCKRTEDPTLIQDVKKQVESTEKTPYSGPQLYGWYLAVDFPDGSNFSMTTANLFTEDGTYDMEPENGQVLQKTLMDIYDRIEGEETPYQINWS